MQIVKLLVTYHLVLADLVIQEIRSVIVICYHLNVRTVFLNFERHLKLSNEINGNLFLQLLLNKLLKTHVTHHHAVQIVNAKK